AVSPPHPSRRRGDLGRRIEGRLAPVRRDGLEPAVPDFLAADVPPAGPCVRSGHLDVPVGIRATDAGEARDGRLLPTHGGRVPSGHMRDPGTSPPERVPSAAEGRFRHRLPRAQAGPLSPFGSRPFRRGRRRLVRAPTENGGERPTARVAALRAVEGGTRGRAAPRPRPNPPRRGTGAGGPRAAR